ncbi:MAG: hypothetical protein HY695_09870 [Deltaproteobacteria bacterium]|nr:hypothetical protein [Deltaproteobacteria bacterium]
MTHKIHLPRIAIAPVVFLTAYFGYRFIERSELIPSGLMVTLGLATLLLYVARRDKEIF